MNKSHLEKNKKSYIEAGRSGINNLNEILGRLIDFNDKKLTHTKLITIVEGKEEALNSMITIADLIDLGKTTKIQAIKNLGVAYDELIKITKQPIPNQLDSTQEKAFAKLKSLSFKTATKIAQKIDEFQEDDAIKQELINSQEPPTLTEKFCLAHDKIL